MPLLYHISADLVLTSNFDVTCKVVSQRIDLYRSVYMVLRKMKINYYLFMYVFTRQVLNLG